MKPFPNCSECEGVDWQKTGSSTDLGVVIDTYKCLICERKNPMQHPHTMTWAYEKPEDALAEGGYA